MTYGAILTTSKATSSSDRHFAARFLAANTRPPKSQQHAALWIDRCWYDLHAESGEHLALLRQPTDCNSKYRCDQHYFVLLVEELVARYVTCTVFQRSRGGIVGLNATRGMDIHCIVLSFVGKSCDRATIN